MNATANDQEDSRQTRAEQRPHCRHEFFLSCEERAGTRSSRRIIYSLRDVYKTG